MNKRKIAVLTTTLIMADFAITSAALSATDEEIIKSAMSAAPEAVAKDATIIAVEADGKMRTVREGKWHELLLVTIWPGQARSRRAHNHMHSGHLRLRRTSHCALRSQ